MSEQKGFRISRLGIDPKKEKEGVWIDAGAGLRLLIARISSPDCEAYVRKHVRNKSPMVSKGIIDEDEIMQEGVKIAASRYLILGWEDLLDDDDNQIQYSTEKALELFEKYPEFYMMVLRFAMEFDRFSLDREDEAVKNLSVGSSGAQTGKSTEVKISPE